MVIFYRCLNSLTSSLKVSKQYQPAVNTCKQRLILGEELDDNQIVADTYGDLGFLYSNLGSHELAIKHLSHQMRIGVDMNDDAIKGEVC